MIPIDLVEAVLRHRGAQRRDDPTRAQDLMRELGVSSSSSFAAFYTQFKGPFPFGSGALELLDIDDHVTPSILEVTAFVHDALGVPHHLVCISPFEGEGFVLYDTRNEAVYCTGLDQLTSLKADVLAPRWNSFVDYLRDYFSDAKN